MSKGFENVAGFQGMSKGLADVRPVSDIAAKGTKQPSILLQGSSIGKAGTWESENCRLWR